MKPNFFLVVLIPAIFSACKPQKAIEFKAAIVQKEGAAFAIMVGKGGAGEKKHHSLAENDFKGAALATDEEEQALDSIINEIKMLSAKGIAEGEELKTAAVNYYVAVKDLETYSRKEIEQQVLSSGADQENLRKAQDSLVKLSIDKRKLFNEVYKREAALHEALRKFETANGI